MTHDLVAGAVFTKNNNGERKRNRVCTWLHDDDESGSDNFVEFAVQLEANWKSSASHHPLAMFTVRLCLVRRRR